MQVLYRAPIHGNKQLHLSSLEFNWGIAVEGIKVETLQIHCKEKLRVEVFAEGSAKRGGGYLTLQVASNLRAGNYNLFPSRAPSQPLHSIRCNTYYPFREGNHRRDARILSLDSRPSNTLLFPVKF
jgi:hypothetical protein